MLISELPEPIKELALKEQERAGNVRNEMLDLMYPKNSGGFYWDETIDGPIFWDKINEGNFTSFYEKYGQPEQVLTTHIATVDVRVRYISIGYEWEAFNGNKFRGNLLMQFYRYPTKEEMIEKICSETNSKDYNTTIISLSEISKEWYEILTKN